MNPNCLEVLVGINSTENIFDSDVDSSDDDQINNSIDYSASNENISHMPVRQNYYLIHTVSNSIWQPPKI
jgi:dihydroneopterin aldolase